jgi:hypothetical protein
VAIRQLRLYSGGSKAVLNSISDAVENRNASIVPVLAGLHIDYELFFDIVAYHFECTSGDIDRRRQSLGRL